MQPLISVIIINYNGKLFLERCFSSLFCLATLIPTEKVNHGVILAFKMKLKK